MVFDTYQIVDDFFNAGHAVDHVLSELDVERQDAVPVFRSAEDATIGAIAVEGIDGATLLQAVVETWNAPAVLTRWQRPVAGSTGWALAERGGRLTVVYLRGNVVYLVSSQNPATLEQVLADMPPGGG